MRSNWLSKYRKRSQNTQRHLGAIETLEQRLALSGDQIVTLPGVAPEYAVYVQDAEFLPILVDPADRLANSDVNSNGVPIVLGDWETNGQLDGWAVANDATHSVANGVLSATLNANAASDLQVTLEDISPGPGLDFGFNDYVQVRLKLPSGYDQEIAFSYGTSTHNGFSAGREFVLPAGEIPADGEWHTYRFDLGLEVFWRDSLEDLQITVPDTGAVGQVVEIDYVEVGDQPGDVLMINTNLNLGGANGEAVVAAGDLTHIESKHFVTWWSPTTNPEFNPDSHGFRALRMLEESYQVYNKILGYIEPFYGPNLQQPVLEGAAILDLLAQADQGVTYSELEFSTPFTIDGNELEFVATFDALKNSSDGSLYNNGQGLQPVANGFVSGGDGNVWDQNEEMTFSYQILEDGVDVSSEYSVSVNGVTARWRNDNDPTITLVLGSDQQEPYGSINYSGFAGPGRVVELVEPDSPIDITDGVSGLVMDVVKPTTSDRFQIRDVQIGITPLSGGSGGGGEVEPPSAVPNLAVDRYKTNHTTWYSGFWMGAKDGFTYFNVGAEGLQDEGWGNPVPHEYAHVVQGAQPAFLLGGHWESHANYLRENWVNYFAPLFPEGDQSHLSLRTFTNSNFSQDTDRFLYQDYRLHFVLQDYAAQFGLDANTAAQLWQVGENNGSLYEKLASLLPEGLSVADVVGESMRLWPVLDFLNGEKMKDNLWTTPDEKAEFDYRIGSMLIPSEDEPGWLRVPFARAPEKYAYMVHELSPTDMTVTVDFRGLDVIGDQEDWRWSLVALDADNNPRYSDSWSPGEHSFELLPDEQSVLLVVVATPGDISLDLASHSNTKPSDKHIDRLRYPYEVKITGAEQAPKQLGFAPGSGAYHTNPDGTQGGWVDSSAFVASTAYLSPNAMVLDTARVEDNARIEDYAVIAGNARVRDNAVVSGYASVIENARVEDNAQVRDRAMIVDTANVLGNAVIEDYAIITNDATVTGNAIARGSTELFFNSAMISGTAILDHDFSMGYTVDDGVHQNHIAFGGWYEDFFADTQRKPQGLIASYRVEAPEGQVLWDEFGARHAVLKGSPTRVVDSEAQGETLRLNGIDQYIVVDRNLYAQRDATFAAWVKPETSQAGQRVFYAGDGQGNFMDLVAMAGPQLPVLRIAVDGVVNSVVSSQTIAVDQWSHVAFSFGDGQMKLYVNGVLAGSTFTPFVPADVLGPGDYTSSEPLYIGRSASGGYFDGKLDDIRFYNVTLSQDDIVAEMNRRGAVLGQFYVNADAAFDGADDRDESGVRNGLERTLTAEILPLSSDNVSYYEAVLDSNDERSGDDGSGFGLDNGVFVVRLDGLGFWDTGVAAEIGVWQEVTVGFDGRVAYLYINGLERASATYQADPEDLAGKNYRIGFGQADDDSYSFFHGQIRNIEILDRMVLPNQVLEGDYNQDAVVDAADYAVWRDALGPAPVPIGSGADGNRNGFIDQGDYVVWRENYGQVLFTSSAAQNALVNSAPVAEEEGDPLHHHYQHTNGGATGESLADFVPAQFSSASAQPSTQTIAADLAAQAAAFASLLRDSTGERETRRNFAPRNELRAFYDAALERLHSESLLQHHNCRRVEDLGEDRVDHDDSLIDDQTPRSNHASQEKRQAFGSSVSTW